MRIFTSGDEAAEDWEEGVDREIDFREVVVVDSKSREARPKSQSLTSHLLKSHMHTSAHVHARVRARTKQKSISTCGCLFFDCVCTMKRFHAHAYARIHTHTRTQTHAHTHAYKPAEQDICRFNITVYPALESQMCQRPGVRVCE